MIKAFQQYWWIIAATIAYFIEPLLKWMYPDISINIVRPPVFAIVLITSGIFAWYAKKKYKENHDFDYKIFFNGSDTERGDTGTPKLVLPEKIREMQAQVFHKNLVFLKDPEAVKEAENILSQPAVHSRPIYKKEKIDSHSDPSQCLLQCLFVPVDKNNNTLMIRRKKENHGSIYFGRDLGNVCFISFSPIPDFYGEKFDREQVYHREVYPTSNRPEVEPYALCMRRDVNNFNYFFLIYKVVYKDVVFSDRENDNTIRDIFGTRDADGKLVENSFFQKDHDVIWQAISFVELQDVREFSWIRVFKGIYTAFKTGKFRSIFRLKFDIVMDVEKEIIKNILKDKQQKGAEKNQNS